MVVLQHFSAEVILWCKIVWEGYLENVRIWNNRWLEHMTVAPNAYTAPSIIVKFC